MKITAIIAEFNPFHNGHKFIIDTAKSNGASVVAVMSGNWVQRGDTAILSKFTRADQALECGADLVVELPTYWAMSTAQKFAMGSMQIINELGADTLMFGSECGDVKRIIKTAYCVRSAEFKEHMRKLLDQGYTPAKSREMAVEELLGNGQLLHSPNDILAVEYVCAAKEINSKIKFQTVKRHGVEHDSNNCYDEYCSASYLRYLIKSNKLQEAKNFMPLNAFEILLKAYKEGKISNIENIEKAILTALRTAPIDEYKHLPDISEGIEHRLYNAARMSSSINQLINLSATKRYTNARLRRLILSAFLKENKERIPNYIPYIRVLGCNKSGAEILQSARKTSNVPIIMRSTSLKGNDCFDFETIATDIYSMSQEISDNCGAEFVNGVIIKR